MIQKLNSQMLGWAMYHRYIQSGTVFDKIDYAVFKALIRWMRRRHPNKNVKWLKRKYIRSTSKRNWTFHARYRDSIGKSATLDLIKLVDIARVRYIKIKGQATPYDTIYKQYFAMRSKASNFRPALSTM